MKHIPITLLLLSGVAVLTVVSCKVNCENPHIYEAKLLNFDSSRDQSVKIISYQGGNNFTTIIDTVDLALTSNSFYHYFEGYKDYKIIFLPENKTHILRDIQFGNEKGQRSGKESDVCSTSASYVIDDSLIRVTHATFEGEGRAITLNIVK